MGGRRSRRSVDDGYVQSTTARMQLADQDVNTDDRYRRLRCRVFIVPHRTSCVDHKDRNDMWPTAAVAFAVVRFTHLRGRRTPGGADRGVPSTEMD